MAIKRSARSTRQQRQLRKQLRKLARQGDSLSIFDLLTGARLREALRRQSAAAYGLVGKAVPSQAATPARKSDSARMAARLLEHGESSSCIEVVT